MNGRKKFITRLATCWIKQFKNESTFVIVSNTPQSHTVNSEENF